MERISFEPLDFLASRTETAARLAGMSRWDYRRNPVSLARVFLYVLGSMEGPQLILPDVPSVIFLFFYMMFHSVTEAAVLNIPYNLCAYWELDSTAVPPMPSGYAGAPGIRQISLAKTWTRLRT